ncbi:hypothetical protein SprV_0401432000 [Sparganum proliferum]
MNTRSAATENDGWRGTDELRFDEVLMTHLVDPSGGPTAPGVSSARANIRPSVDTCLSVCDIVALDEHTAEIVRRDWPRASELCNTGRRRDWLYNWIITNNRSSLLRSPASRQTAFEKIKRWTPPSVPNAGLTL